MPRKTYYEILCLDERCTAREIRASFVTLSKKYHPDTNALDPALHEKFVQINEAYSVLSKSTLRQVYDSDMRSRRNNFYPQNYKYSNYTNPRDPQVFRWYDDSIRPHHNYQRSSHHRADAYYGIKGIPRKSNASVAAGACVFLIFGAWLHYLAFKHSRTFSMSKINEMETISKQYSNKMEGRNNLDTAILLLEKRQSQVNERQDR